MDDSLWPYESCVYFGTDFRSTRGLGRLRRRLVVVVRPVKVCSSGYISLVAPRGKVERHLYMTEESTNPPLPYRIAKALVWRRAKWGQHPMWSSPYDVALSSSATRGQV